MYMYINLKLLRQKWSTNLGVKNVFPEESIDHHIHGVSSKISNTP